MRRVKDLSRLKFLLVFLLYLFLASLCFYRDLFDGKLIASGDALLYYYPLKLYYAESFWRHGFHWWLPYQYLGLPFLGTLQTGILYPLNWFYFFLPARYVPYGFNWSLIVHYALACYFTYLYVRLLGLKEIPAFLSGVVFGLSGFMMAHQQTINMQNAGVWLPLLLYFYEKIRRDLRVRDALWAGITAGIQQLAGHTQICVYTTFILGLFALFFVFYQERGKKFRFLVLCALPVVLGVLIALPQIVSTAQLLFRSVHSRLPFAEIVGWSFPPLAIPMMVFPFIFGGGYSSGPVWGITYVLEESGFIGVLPLVVSAWILLYKGGKNLQIRFWGTTALAALFLVFGKYNPLGKFLFHFPVMSLFRAPDRNWFEFDFAAAVLFAFGMEELICCSEDRKKCWIPAALGMGCIFVLGFLLLFTKNDYLSVHLSSYSHLEMRQILHSFRFSSPVFFVPMLFILCDLIFIVMLNFSSGVRKIAIGLLVISICMECFSFSFFAHDKRFEISDVKRFTQNPVYQFLATRSNFSRFYLLQGYSSHVLKIWPVLNIPDHLGELDGYDPLIPNRFFKLLGMVRHKSNYSPWNFLLKNNLILDLLNVKYLIVPPWVKPKFYRMKFRLSSSGLEGKVMTGPWMLGGAGKVGKVYVLRSSGKLQASVIAKRINLKARRHYVFVFKIKAPLSPSSKLNLEVYVPGKPLPINKIILQIDPGKIKSYFKRFFTLYAGNVHGRAYVRLYTFSKTPVLIKDPRVYFYNKYRPIFGRRKRNLVNRNRPLLLYTKVFHWNGYSIYENSNVLPKFFSVRKLASVQNLEQLREKIFLLRFIPSQTAYVSPRNFSRIGRIQFSQGRVVISHYGTDRIVAETKFRRTGFVVLSDQYYPGWKAYLDGKRVPIYRTDGLLRGVMIPPGSHLLEFRYNPMMIKVCLLFAAVFTALCFICLLLCYRGYEKL
jgi:hypothetical protein